MRLSTSARHLTMAFYSRKAWNFRSDGASNLNVKATRSVKEEDDVR